MTINTTVDKGTVTIALAGRLDAVTAPELMACLEDSLGSATGLRIDCSALEYISSAGLRVLMKARSAMATKGPLTITGVNDMIREVFDITGFADVFTLE